MNFFKATGLLVLVSSFTIVLPGVVMFHFGGWPTIAAFAFGKFMDVVISNALQGNR